MSNGTLDHSGAIDLRGWGAKLARAKNDRDGADRRLTQIESALANGARVHPDDLIQAEASVRHTELALAGIQEQYDQAVEKVGTIVPQVRDFVIDTLKREAANAHPDLAGVDIIGGTFFPTLADAPSKPTLIVVQHEHGHVDAYGTCHGMVQMKAFGEMPGLDEERLGRSLGKWVQHFEFGNYPHYFLTIRGGWTPNPVMTATSASTLSDRFVQWAKNLNYGYWGSHDGVHLSAHAIPEAEGGSLDGTTVTVSGAFNVGTLTRVAGYLPNDLAHKMTGFIQGQGGGEFIPGVGMLQSARVTKVSPLPNGLGVRIAWEATGRRQDPDAKPAKKK